MTESDLPFIKPGPEIPPETDEHFSPTPDVKNPMPKHEPNEKSETEDLICPICGKPFNKKADLDLHMAKDHGKINKV